MIINSLLDTDLYKFTMMQAVYHHFPDTVAEYQFICRTPNIDFKNDITHIQKELDHLCTLRLQEDELEYLRNLPFFKNDFIDHIKDFQLNTNHVSIKQNDNLEITIAGPWFETILFEVPLLAIINETHFSYTDKNKAFQEGINRLEKKINLINNSPVKNDFHFSDFGTRRRFSFNWQEKVLQTCIDKVPENLVGTSNIYYAKKLGIKPIGTMAHEFIQAAQVLAPSLAESQRFAWNIWLQEYDHQLSAALSDTINLNAFLHDFGQNFCKNFDAIRQDSGDPFEWGEAIIRQYEKFGLDPKSKTIIFSDSLNFPLALKLCEHFSPRIHVSFGIGTNLMNDIGAKAIQIVIKLSECDKQPVAKLSDNPEKIICKDPKFLERLKKAFHI